jgi:hypothetical protein
MKKKMMEHKTGRILPDGTPIMLGDRLQGSITAEVVVLWDEENKNYGVEIIGRDDFWWELDYYLSKWHDLKRTGNINKRQ